MNKNLKKCLDELLSFCNDWYIEIKTELMDMLMYLSSGDGIICEYESAFIKDYLGFDYSPESMKSYICENHIYSEEFENRVPETFKLLVDEAIFFGPDEPADFKAYIEVFSASAKEFVACDGNVTEQEITDMNIYINMLNSYAEHELINADKYVSSVNVDEIMSEDDNDDVQMNMEDVSSDDGVTLKDLLDELNSLIGLPTVKQDVLSLIHLQEIKKIRKARALPDIPISNHLVFYGNPGTGKTTVARLLARIYHKMGILSKGTFVEVDRSGLVAGYVGQTAIKTKEVLDSAIGGVLFIDEAYSLAYSTSDIDYGREAIDTILKAMEDSRGDLIVIVAGYPGLMTGFINSNPGLRSRFNKYINFVDYSPEELVEIFKLMCRQSGYTYTDAALARVTKILADKCANKGENFANAREVRNMLETAFMHQADRLFGRTDISDDELMTLEEGDFR